MQPICGHSNATQKIFLLLNLMEENQAKKEKKLDELFTKESNLELREETFEQEAVNAMDLMNQKINKQEEVFKLLAGSNGKEILVEFEECKEISSRNPVIQWNRELF